MADFNSLLLQLGQKAADAGEAGRLAMAGNAEYLEFRNEVVRIAAPTSTDPPDWSRIERLAVGLAAQTPDLLVFSHVCLAVVNTRGYGALAAAFTAFRDLMRDGWAIATRTKQWQEVLKTFSRRMALGVRNRPPERSSLNDLRAANDAANELSSTITGNGGPPLVELLEALQGFVTALAPPPPRPVEPPPAPRVEEDLAAAPVAPAAQLEQPAAQAQAAAQVAPAQPVQPVAQPAAPPPAQAARPAAPINGAAVDPEPASADEDGRSRSVIEREIGQNLVRLASILREENVQDPAPYRMIRVLMWATAKPPQADKQQKTRLPPPPPHVMKRIQSPIPDGKWKDAIRESEELFRTYPLWLDLQLRVVRSLEGLQAGPPLDAVAAEVATLLGRIPELLELKFNTGIPLASDDTIAWCRQAIARQGSTAAIQLPSLPVAVSTPLAPAASAPPVQVVYTPPPPSADEDGSSHPLPQGFGPALAALHDRTLKASSLRRRFEIRLDMVGLCLSTGRLDLASPLLQALEQELDQHHLEQWEPKLAARARVLQLLAARAGGNLEGSRQTRAQLWARLCLLSPAEALAIGPEP